MAEQPEARHDAEHPAWGPAGDDHHFAEPLFGYYRSTDEWVYRKHAEMLADAGIDDCGKTFSEEQLRNTVPGRLRKAGYQTALFDKWGIGGGIITNSFRMKSV